MYIGRMFRPPSEGYSVIIQVTIGCAHNTCQFCSMYKEKNFAIRSWEEIKGQIDYFAQIEPNAKRVFLADGDALVLSTETLIKITAYLKSVFPRLERISSYSTPLDLLGKSEEDLKAIRTAGISLLYLGLESGSEAVLNQMKKGVTPSQMIEAAKKAKAAGFDLSVTVISGLGGQEQSEHHARETAKVLNQMQPNYLGLLTLLLDQDTPINQWVQSGDFKLLTPVEAVQETYWLLEDLNLDNCMFRSNHASNYLALAGNLPQDKAALMEELKNILESPETLSRAYHRRL